MGRGVLLVASLVVTAGVSSASAAKVCDVAEPWKCSFTHKKLLWCDGQRCLDAGSCATTANERKAATQAACQGMGWPAPSGYDKNGKPYPNFKLSSPLVAMTCADDTDCVAPEVCTDGRCRLPAAPCLAGGKRYWKRAKANKLRRI